MSIANGNHLKKSNSKYKYLCSMPAQGYGCRTWDHGVHVNSSTMDIRALVKTCPLKG